MREAFRQLPAHLDEGKTGAAGMFLDANNPGAGLGSGEHRG